MSHAIIEAGLVRGHGPAFAFLDQVKQTKIHCTYFARLATNSGRKRHPVAFGCTDQAER